MKRAREITFVAVFMVMFMLVLGGTGIAAEETSSWRETYDLILRWVNFLILAVLIFKFARVPLKNFLKGQRDKLAADIRKKEKEKEIIISEVDEMMKTLEESETRFEDMKNRIIEQGQKRKEQIIEDAKQQSRQMMEEAKKRVQNQIRQAKLQFKTELVDAAVDVALARLPQEVTSEDNQKILDQFLSVSPQRTG